MYLRTNFVAFVSFVSILMFAGHVAACEMNCYPKQIASFDTDGKGLFCVKCNSGDCLEEEGDGFIRTFKFDKKASQPGKLGIKYLCVSREFEAEK